MRARSRAVLIGMTGAAMLVFGALLLPHPGDVAAQRAAAAPADLPAGYAGADACKACHEPSFRKFETTVMGRLFLKHPRNTQEALACENCHGPGKAHVEAGGGRGAGDMITFAKNDPTPVEKRNAMCLACHTKGARLFWEGSAHDSRDVACTGCHVVMTDISPHGQLAKETVMDTCGTCHLKQRAQQMRTSHMPLREGKMTCTSCHNPHGTVTQALLQGQLAERQLLPLPRGEGGAVPVGARARRRELRELSRRPRLAPREDAEDAEAAPVPAVLHRGAAPHAPARTPSGFAFTR